MFAFDKLILRVMRERILKLLAEEKISAAEFADKMGVQRSNVSHILNGRNNPGFSFIQKILETYPSLNSRWLITGEGLMYENNKIATEVNLKSKDLFSTQPVIETINHARQSFKEDSYDIIGKVEQKKALEPSVNQELIQKKIVRILFFYNDHTFENFLPAENL